MPSNINSSFFTQLSKKEKKTLFESISKRYNCDLSFLESNEFYKTPKMKVYMSTFSLKDIKSKRVNSLGVYFGTFHDENRFRLSIEGTQYIKPAKNYVELKKEALASYLAAENLFEEDIITFEENDAEFLIVVFNEECMGSISKKQDYYLNYIPKSRKLDFNKVF